MGKGCGGANQGWKRMPDGSIRDTMNGTCLTVYPSDGINWSLRGWQITSLPCASPVTENQKWTVESDGTVHGPPPSTPLCCAV